jgi:hypothetical protein
MKSMFRTIRMGTLALAAVGLLTLGACAIDPGEGMESVSTQSAPVQTLAPTCDGPAEGEVIVESSGVDGGIPYEGTLLLGADPPGMSVDRNSSGAAVKDADYTQLIDLAYAPTQCLLKILSKYCPSTDAPYRTDVSWEGCNNLPHRLDLARCMDAVEGELLSENCGAYAEIFASSASLPPFDGLYVAFDPVGSGTHKN